MYELDLQDGKYTIILSDDCSKFKALRYGENWRNLTGDNLVLALVYKIQELEETLKIVNSKNVNMEGEGVYED